MKNTLDFIVIGAQKAGTTSLFEYLRQHPELYLPPGKEMPYFSHEAILRRGWDDYMSKAFHGAPAERKWGTVTPQYMVGGLWEEPNPTRDGVCYDERTVPLRIHERAPQARLIAILRDPAERARAHHRMSMLNQLDARPFARVVEELVRPEALAAARRQPEETSGYVVWGEYGRILSGYLDVFPREQLLVLFTDDLEHDPIDALRRIHGFLGVRLDFVPDNIGVRYRVGGTERRVRWLGNESPLHPWTIQRRLAADGRARALWHRLPEGGRRGIDRALARVTYRLDLWNRRRRGGSRSDDDEIALDRLRAYYAADAALLTALIGSAPPWSR